MQDGETLPLKFQLILPTPHLPPTLTHITNPPITQFLVGYRNVLTVGRSGISWGLVKNNGTCGRAFVFEISQTEANNIQQIKQSGEMIETTGNNYILLKIQKQFTKPTEELTSQQLKQLLEDVGGINKISLNLVKNAFNSLKMYQIIAEKAVRALDFQDKRVEMTVTEKVKIQYNAKTLSGSSLLEVPEISKETGNKLGGKTLTLKVKGG